MTKVVIFSTTCLMSDASLNCVFVWYSFEIYLNKFRVSSDHSIYTSFSLPMIGDSRSAFLCHHNTQNRSFNCCSSVSFYVDKRIPQWSQNGMFCIQIWFCSGLFEHISQDCEMHEIFIWLYGIHFILCCDALRCYRSDLSNCNPRSNKSLS